MRLNLIPPSSSTRSTLMVGVDRVCRHLCLCWSHAAHATAVCAEASLGDLDRFIGMLKKQVGSRGLGVQQQHPQH
jgi:hypothetical protein